MNATIARGSVFFAPWLVALVWSAWFSEGSNGDAIDAGRRVYVAEGCIHCHSQFVRPGIDEDQGLGSARSTDFARLQSPVLIGNRRQGPDLANVGLRRPREWQRLHLVSPAVVSPGSLMPSYAHLFERDAEGRGEALLDYLDSLGREITESTGSGEPAREERRISARLRM
ncbi:hypothetical protein ASA1KI_35020 [Opitutales bacterium ASA1]|uniref:cbb3-type cytochrome c oxidase subunit II n=1 Tax=Congregicoccus parvus TaxID=3081749 RepID=UPI002B2A2CC4|nr:hypothetical protein ASA1KI_35020 [Opitutales bacterium ASA1]